MFSIVACLSAASPAFAQEHHDHDTAPAAQHDHRTMEHDAPPEDHDAHKMRGLYGSYGMGRDASGTSWQPDVSTHGGVHGRAANWDLMGHALLNGVYVWQEGARGDEKAFLAGMFMGAARRDFANNDTVNLRLMMSPDPLMGKSGYPLLFAAGETADGATELIDAQHPHDLFMELSASYTHRFDDGSSVFGYVGLPGEPAFGPPAFMHRLSAMDSPEAPLSHHWIDSTHITFGVVTAGYVRGPFKIEASRFRGREPDQDRFDIEEPRLDSTAVRVSVNPAERLSLQVSWADIESPEQLHPDEDEERWSASAIYAQPIGSGLWTTTFAFGTKAHDGGHWHNAWLIESALKPNDEWTYFARAEQIETGALAPDIEADVQRLSVGAIRDFRISDSTVIGVGALVQQHFAPDSLEDLYGGDPNGGVAFVRLKIG
ncbi:MAG: hypothetical protein ABW199_11355 [Caulobacterales bacterium]